MGGPKKVFCSHRGVDKAEVEAFARRLRDAGVDAWFDKWEISAGDDIVASMNRGLEACDVGLLFFSSRVWAGNWFDNEVSALVVARNEDGVRLIPVMIDADVKLPALLRPFARRSIDHFDQIVDAINGVSRKPKLGPTTATRGTTRFTLRLVGPKDGTIDLVAVRNGAEVARESDVPLTRTLQQSYAEFLQGHTKFAARGPAEAAHQSLSRALVELGETLGSVLFAKQIGDALRASLNGVSASESLELCFEAGDPMLLSLPFEAARLDGAVPALKAGVTVRRIVVGATPIARRAAASPLKLLVAVGAPDEGKSANAVLDLENELQGILDAVSEAARDENVEVRFLEVGHPTEISNALARDEYHVLHLSGHGGPSSIELEDEDGAAVNVTAKDLADALANTNRNIPLVFLSSCHGGTASSETASLAVNLVREGVPLVLSMQTRVTDRYASELSREFYAELAKRESPLASRALAVARQRLEAARIEAVERGASPLETQPEYATASLFGGENEVELVDYALERAPLRKPPVHRVPGPVPQLGIGELVGRRSALRALLRVLRDHEDSVAAIGKKAGVVLTGIGGVGKSSLAGRAMARLKEDGWILAATTGRFSIGGIAMALGAGLIDHADPRFDELGAKLANPQLDDSARLNGITKLLQTQRVLLVLDNFEDNLEIGGNSYLDETTPAWLQLFAERAQVGKLLFTCRYPLPEGTAYFAQQPLGPLTPAETRKLFLRLPGIQGLAQEDLKEVMRHIGGHPRMLEYLDGILRKGNARLPAVAERLRVAAKQAGVPLTSYVGSLDETLRNTVLLGARDILLDELVALADVTGDTETLLQCGVSSLPIDAAGVAHALADAAPTASQVRDAQVRLERLVDLSLVTALDADAFWVHRWTAEALAALAAAEEHRARFARAGRYRLSRTSAGGIEFEDIAEATHNFLDAEQFDAASEFALQIAQFLVGANQSAAAAGFAGEILRRLPATSAKWARLVDIEAQSLWALGFTQSALSRYHSLLATFEERFRREPDRADYQSDLGTACDRLGDLMRDLGQGDQAHALYERSLTISELLVQGEPDRADYQRDLAVACSKLGDLMRALGQGEQARVLYERSMTISELLVQGEPDRADFQRDLSVACSKLGDLMHALGQGDQARALYERSLAIRERLIQGEPDRADFQRDLSTACSKLGDLVHALGQGDQARALYERSLAIRERLVQGEPDRADYQHDLTGACDRLGDLMRAIGERGQALTLYERSLAISERLVQAEPDRADYQRDLSVACNKLGDLMRAIGERGQALTLYERSLAISEQLVQAEPDRADYQRDLSVPCEKLGDLMRALGQEDPARVLYERSLAIRERLVQAEPDRADYQRDLSVACNKLGDLMRDLGHAGLARAYFEKDLEIAERLAQAEPNRADYQRDLLVSLMRMIDANPTRAPKCLARGQQILRDLEARGATIEHMDEFKQAFGVA